MDNLTPITREEILMNDESLTPITREEKILAGEDLNPVTRREYFLKKYRHAGGDVMVEGLEVTANGTYTAPEGKAYSPVEVDVPLPDNAYLLKEASGSLVSFTDGADLPMPSFICNIDAVQDLHGQDAPWVGGAGKNKLANVLSELKSNNTSGTWSGNVYTINSGTIEILTDTADNILGYKVNGTFTGSSSFILAGTAYKLLSDFANNSNFVISQEVEGSGANGFCLQRQEAGSNIYIPNNQNYTTVNPSSDTTNHYRPILRFNNGDSIANKTYVLMIRNSADSSDFAPYSNICPISGHTGLNAWVRGKNLFDISTLVLKPWNGNNTNNARARAEHAIKLPIGTTFTCSFSDDFTSTYDYSITQLNSDYPATTILDETGWKHDSSITITNNYSEYVGITISRRDFGNITLNDLKNTQIQIEIGTTATTYEPYNPNSQTIQVSWQTEAGEVFGGYVDLVSGVLTVTHKSQTGFTRGSQDSSNKLYNIGTIWDMKTFTGGGISPYFVDSMFEKMSLGGARTAEIPCIAQYIGGLYVGGYIGKEAELDTLLETLQVKYELETPITYQLTPTQIKSLVGENNAWCSTGDVDIDYFAKEVTG